MAGLRRVSNSTLLTRYFELSKRLQPRNQIRMLPPVFQSVVCVEQRFCFGQRLPFSFEIDGEIFVCSIDADVAEPVGNRAEINSGTQQVDGGAVADGVRMQAFVTERRL